MRRVGEVIPIEELGDLFKNFVSSRIGASPSHCRGGNSPVNQQGYLLTQDRLTRGVKSIHDAVELQRACRVDVRPDSTNLLCRVEDDDFESVRDEMSSGGDASDSSSDDGDSTAWFHSRRERDVGDGEEETDYRLVD